MDLNEIREELRKDEPGRWHFSSLYEEVDVAFSIGKWPTEFWAAHPIDKAYAVARSRAVRDVTAFERKLEEEEAEQERKNRTANRNKF